MTAAKGWFVVAGLGIQLVLPRVLRSPAEYGLYAAATALLAILTNTLTQACVQTASKHAAEATGETAPESLRRSLEMSLAAGALLASLLALLAEPIADGLLHDPALAPLLRVLAILPLGYALYATAIGHLNGLRAFGRQATLDGAFTTVRAVALIAGAALSASALGTATGFAIAGLAVAGLGLGVAGVGRGGSRGSRRAWLAFFLAIAMHQLALNGLLQLDVELLKSRVAALAIEAGVLADRAAEQASTEVGLYRAAQSVAFVPYQLILAVTLVLFPTVARARTLGDVDGARAAVRGALRFATIALVVVAVPTSGGGDAAIRMLLDARYAPGGDALTVLALAQVAFTLFVVGSTSISGDGSPVVVALSAATGLVVMLVVGWLSIDAAGLDGSLRVAAALGSAAGCVVSMAIVLGLVAQRFGAQALPLATFVRGTLAGAAGLVVARVLPHTARLDSLGALVAGALTSLVVLAVVGELGAADVALVRRIVTRARG